MLTGSEKKKKVFARWIFKQDHLLSIACWRRLAKKTSKVKKSWRGASVDFLNASQRAPAWIFFVPGSIIRKINNSRMLAIILAGFLSMIIFFWFVSLPAERKEKKILETTKRIKYAMLAYRATPPVCFFIDNTSKNCLLYLTL
jgi:hypothetical protein